MAKPYPSPTGQCMMKLSRCTRYKRGHINDTLDTPQRVCFSALTAIFLPGYERSRSATKGLDLQTSRFLKPFDMGAY